MSLMRALVLPWLILRRPPRVLAAVCLAATFTLDAAPLSEAQMSVLRERDARYAMPMPSPAAMELAAKIGREGNVDGFRAMAALRNATLLHQAANSYESVAPKALPDALEALIVEHYADEVVQRPLLALLARKFDKEGRYPKYRGRKLFELLYADLKARKDPLHHAIRIVATELKDVEPELVALLPGLDPASANEIVMLLGQRRYAPAVPALQALQARIPPERNQNQLLEHINWALLQIGTPAAVQAALDRLRALGRSTDPRAANEVWTLLLNVTALPAGSPPDYAELRAALPREMSQSAWGQLVKLIETRKEKRGIPELVLAVTKVPGDDAVNALLALGEPADWRAARERLGRGDTALAPERVAVLQKRLDDALADPAKFAAARRQDERQQALHLGQRRFGEEKSRLAALRSTDPARYAAEWRALIERREAELRDYADLPHSVGARGDLAREWTALAFVLRFDLRRPDEAIAAYQAASKLRRGLPDNVDLTALFIADIQRFDRRDASKAIEQYRMALSALSQASDSRSGQAAALSGLRRWVEREIAYLQGGKRFSGKIAREDMAAARLWLLIAMSQQDMPPALQEAMSRAREPSMLGIMAAAPPDMLRALEALPPSQFHLAYIFAAELQFPYAARQRFLAKHDPAGYLSAALLAASGDPGPRRAPPDAR